MMIRIIFAAVLVAIAGGIYLWATGGMILAGPDAGENIRFGFIRSVSTNGNFGIAFDEAEWLTGEEGEQAAIDAGLCTEATRNHCLPNEFIISNPSRALEQLEFGTDISIVLMTLNMESEGVHETQISKEEFEKLINDSRAHWHELPYQILIRSGLVRIIEEVYVP